MNFEEYFSYDALGLAELVRTNQISESELLEITIELCNRIDPKINAVPIKHFELARKEAKSFKNKGLFRGVPFLLKDLNNYLKGTVTTGGSRVLENIEADHSSELVKRTIEAGLNISYYSTSFLTHLELYLLAYQLLYHLCLSQKKLLKSD